MLNVLHTTPILHPSLDPATESNNMAEPQKFRKPQTHPAPTPAFVPFVLVPDLLAESNMVPVRDFVPGLDLVPVFDLLPDFS